jgi:hypothetical protein
VSAGPFALVLVLLVIALLLWNLLLDHNRVATELANVWRILDRASLDNNRDPKSGATTPELYARAVKAQLDAQREEEPSERLGSGGR